MRRLIALVIIGLVLAIAITELHKKEKRSAQTERQTPLNYFQELEDCGAACLPVAAILMVVADY